MELPPHRSRDRRAPRDGQSLRPDAPGKCGQNVPRLRRVPTTGFARSSAWRRIKCGQNVRRLGVKTGQNVPRLGAAPRFAAAVYRTAITEKLDAGLSLQRIWQDLVEEYGYGASYESVKRFVRTIAPTRRAVGVFTARPAPKARSISSAARRRSMRRPASGVGRGCFA